MKWPVTLASLGMIRVLNWKNLIPSYLPLCSVNSILFIWSTDLAPISSKPTKAPHSVFKEKTFGYKSPLGGRKWSGKAESSLPLSLNCGGLSIFEDNSGGKVFLLQKDTRTFPSCHVTFIAIKRLSLFHVQALLLVNYF